MAQLDNAADSDSEDRGFESLRAGQFQKGALQKATRLFLRSFAAQTGGGGTARHLPRAPGRGPAPGVPRAIARGVPPPPFVRCEAAHANRTQRPVNFTLSKFGSRRRRVRCEIEIHLQYVQRIQDRIKEKALFSGDGPLEAPFFVAFLIRLFFYSPFFDSVRMLCDVPVLF